MITLLILTLLSAMVATTAASEFPGIALVRGFERHNDAFVGGPGRMPVTIQPTTIRIARSSRPPSRSPDKLPDFETSDGDPQPAALTLRLLRASPSATLEGTEPQKVQVHYLLGNDPTAWRTDVRTYGAVRSRDVYPGIDWIHYPTGSGIEFDFLVKPGGDPRRIQLHVEGAESIHLDADGNAVLQWGNRAIRLKRPILAQKGTGSDMVSVAGGYQQMDATTLGFNVGDYDPKSPLLIDPALDYSTFLGGDGDESGAGIAVDAQGNAYVTGWTTSVGFDRGSVFIAKVNSAGSKFDYISFVGGDDLDQAMGIAVNNAGHAFVVGHTASLDFPVTNAIQNTLHGQSDAFVFELNADGKQLVFSTLLGGNGSEIDLGFGQIISSGAGIAVDSLNAIYVTGSTSSSDFPVTANAFQRQSFNTNQFAFSADAFVTKLAPGGKSLVYSTYLGGAGLEQVMGMAVDTAGQAWITGSTASRDFPTRNPLQRNSYSTASVPFLSKLSADGASLLFSTYLSGSGRGTGIALDGSGAVYITGATSGGLPSTPGAFQRSLQNASSQDAFAMKLSASGDEVLYATYLGGRQADTGYGIAVTGRGEAVIVGSTRSHPDFGFPTGGFPARNPLQQLDQGLDEKAFIVKLNAAGDALYSSPLGGDFEEFARAVAIDAAGAAYLTGETRSSNFPVRNPIQPGMTGLEAFVTKVVDSSDASATQTTVVDQEARSFTQRFYRARLLSE